MKRLATSLRANGARNRNRTFVGRDAERQRLARWLRSESAPTTIVDITGLGGIGKSTLLNVFLHDAEECGAYTAWIDGRACFGTPEGVLRHLPATFLQWMQTPDVDTKWVLGIDNFEALRDLGGWLRHNFFAVGPASNLLILVCERNSSLMEWRLDLDWAGRVEEWALEPFTIGEAITFLRRRGIPFDANMAVVGQVPLTLAIYADLYQRGALEGEGVRMAREAFSATLLKEVLHTEWREAINVLCLVSRAHLDFLNAVLEQPLSVADYRQLASVSFVTDTPSGLGLHDLAAGELLREFRRCQPEAFHRLRCKVIGELARAWQQAPDNREDGRLAHDLVRLVGRDLEPWRDYADLYEDPHGLEIVPYEPADRLDALQCLNEWARPAIPMSLARTGCVVRCCGGQDAPHHPHGTRPFGAIRGHNLPSTGHPGHLRHLKRLCSRHYGASCRASSSRRRPLPAG
ncbi:AAA family ATPase [Sulfobacillus harzensis]|uniref:ATP-binding protein n=1 Tax=Sulfobacillus harzensis TaxID=2729629 RepID=A0A7Y0L870_9FIRM|nr:ATP-binding protein [Sulfobacillus harzensis]NMP24772.1 ATP-binding protein [Sulfobacillus harzensis]